MLLNVQISSVLGTIFVNTQRTCPGLLYTPAQYFKDAPLCRFAADVGESYALYFQWICWLWKFKRFFFLHAPVPAITQPFSKQKCASCPFHPIELNGVYFNDTTGSNRNAIIDKNFIILLSTLYTSIPTRLIMNAQKTIFFCTNFIVLCQQYIMMRKNKKMQSNSCKYKE